MGFWPVSLDLAFFKLIDDAFTDSSMDLKPPPTTDRGVVTALVGRLEMDVILGD